MLNAVNLVEGGTLEIARSIFANIDRRDDVTVIALVNNKLLFPSYCRIKLLEISWPKRNWLLRLFFEFFSSYYISNRILPNVWFAIHDITPRVNADHQFVYCHNPTPFYSAGFRDLIFQPTVFLFSLGYNFIYRLNIQANHTVFVQQNHIRDYFLENYPVDKVVVARPISDFTENISDSLLSKSTRRSEKIQLFYPTLPRSFKNIELLIDAARLLHHEGFDHFEIVITIAPEDSLYARYLAFKSRNVAAVRFIGRLSPEQVRQEYRLCDALVFPSKLETWGLPLTEAKSFGLPVLAADLPYAKETLGNYNRVSFFDPDNPQQLAALIKKLHNDRQGFQGNQFSLSPDVPVVNGWSELVDYIIKVGLSE